MLFWYSRQPNYVDPQVEHVDVEALQFEVIPSRVSNEPGRPRALDAFEKTGERIAVKSVMGGWGDLIIADNPDIKMVQIWPSSGHRPDPNANPPYGSYFILTVFSSQIAIAVKQTKRLDNGDLVRVLGDIALCYDQIVFLDLNGQERGATKLLTNCSHFKNRLRQEKVLAILVKGLSAYNHWKETDLLWPDGRKVTQEEKDVSDVYKEDGQEDVQASLKAFRKVREEKNWQFVDKLYKRGNASVEFTSELAQRLEQGVYLG